jgi:predicted RNase H-like nuclease
MCIIQSISHQKSFFYSNKIPYIYFMNKRDTINKAISILKDHNIMEGQDYIISLQGPTIIPTQQGTPKITPNIIDSLIPTGIGIML